VASAYGWVTISLYCLWLNEHIHYFLTPPSRLHELDFMTSDDTIHFLTHVNFVLDLSLFWFMMKHKGMYYEILLGWFHSLFDCT
jgi:hypothetical protein